MLFFLREEANRAGIHDVELHVRMSCPVRRLGTAARSPTIAHETFDRVQFPFCQHFPRLPLRSSHNQLQNAVIHTYPTVSQFWTYNRGEYLKLPAYDRNNPPCKFCE